LLAVKQAFVILTAAIVGKSGMCHSLSTVISVSTYSCNFVVHDDGIEIEMLLEYAHTGVLFKEQAQMNKDDADKCGG
jgi:hypothetical protein